MRLILLANLLILLISCKTVPAYKIVRELIVSQPEKPICYYKKISDIQKQKMKCFAIDAKDKNGKYLFEDHLIISKRLFRETLHKTIDSMFKEK